MTALEQKIADLTARVEVLEQKAHAHFGTIGPLTHSVICNTDVCLICGTRHGGMICGYGGKHD